MRKTLAFFIGSLMVAATLGFSSPASAAWLRAYTETRANGYVEFRTAGAPTGESFVLTDTRTNGKYVYAYVWWRLKDGTAHSRVWKNNTYQRTINWALPEGIPVVWHACEGGSSIDWGTCGTANRTLA